jgi:amino acid efflux transporter
MGDGMQLFYIQDMLSIVGQNFLILYGIVGISLFRLSPSKIEKTIAVIAILLTAALAIFEGPSLLYPLCLAGAGWLVFRISAR